MEQYAVFVTILLCLFVDVFVSVIGSTCAIIVTNDSESERKCTGRRQIEQYTELTETYQGDVVGDGNPWLLMLCLL